MNFTHGHGFKSEAIRSISDYIKILELGSSTQKVGYILMKQLITV
jgi:hypothetical protein